MTQIRLLLTYSLFLLHTTALVLSTADGEGTCANTCSPDTVCTERSDYSANTLVSWINSVTTSINSIFSPKSKAPQKKDDASDFNELLLSAREMARSLGKDVDLFDEDQLGIQSQLDQHLSYLFHSDEKEIIDDTYSGFVYPPLTRRTVKKPGNVIDVDIGGGKNVQLIARSINPPLYEIPNFLTDEECDHIISKSIQKGTVPSATFTSEKDKQAGLHFTAHRVSESIALEEADVGSEFQNRLYAKVAKLIDMPEHVIRNSAPLTISKYQKGGRYNAHLDSNEDNVQVPCCFQKRCNPNPGPDQESKDCCRICRYLTVLYYLSDVEEGGETAFPLADLSLSQINNLPRDYANLTKHCHTAQVRIKPEKGKAIMWYNHFVDRHDYLGPVDRRTRHGGCEVVKGTKWIATNWISTPRFSWRRKPSKYGSKDVKKEQSNKDSEHSNKESEQLNKDSEQSNNESEQLNTESERIKNESEQSISESERSSNGAEQPTSEPEQSINESEQSINKSEQMTNESEQLTSESEQSNKENRLSSNEELLK